MVLGCVDEVFSGFVELHLVTYKTSVQFMSQHLVSKGCATG